MNKRLSQFQMQLIAIKKDIPKYVPNIKMKDRSCAKHDRPSEERERRGEKQTNHPEGYWHHWLGLTPYMLVYTADRKKIQSTLTQEKQA